jgi:hypothetical protein
LSFRFSFIFDADITISFHFFHDILPYADIDDFDMPLSTYYAADDYFHAAAIIDFRHAIFITLAFRRYCYAPPLRLIAIFIDSFAFFDTLSCRRRAIAFRLFAAR